MVGKKETLGPMWKVLRKESDLVHPTPLLNQVFWGCTQRETQKLTTMLFKPMQTFPYESLPLK